MKAEPLDPVAERDDANSPEAVAEDIRRAAKEGWANAERLLADGIEAVRAQTKAYAEDPAQTLDEAQRFIVGRVKERPVTAAFAGLGLGVLIGLLLSSRGK